VHGARRHGYVLAETTVAIGVTIVIAVLFSAAVVQYARARRDGDTRRILRLAAATELERVRAGLPGLASRPAVPAQAGRVNPQGAAAGPGEIGLETTVQPGEGPWAGMQQVRVVASRQMPGGRVLRVELAAYVADAEVRP
jgi:hypothetical protein